MSDSIATNASGFIVKHDQTQHQVEWNDILEISAYKVDLWMTDMICLAFELSDGRVLEINEEQEGYRGLLAARRVTISAKGCLVAGSRLSRF